MTREEQIIKAALDCTDCTEEWFNDKGYIGESNSYDDAHSFVAGARWSDENPKNLTLNEYQDKAMTTCTESSANDTYALFQLPAEVGELMDKVAKARRKEIITFVDDNIYPGKNGIQDGVRSLEYAEFYEGIFKELGDIMWSCAQIAKRMGWTLEEVCKGNLDKLADRAKRGVIVGNGDNR